MKNGEEKVKRMAKYVHQVIVRQGSPSFRAVFKRKIEYVIQLLEEWLLKSRQKYRRNTKGIESSIVKNQILFCRIPS